MDYEVRVSSGAETLRVSLPSRERAVRLAEGLYKEFGGPDPAELWAIDGSRAYLVSILTEDGWSDV